MKPPKIGETLDLMVQVAEQGDIAGACFTDSLIALCSVPDEELEEYMATMIQGLADAESDANPGENDLWHFVCDRVLESLRLTTVLFEVAKAEALDT